MYALRSRLSAPLLKLLSPFELPEDRIVEAIVFVSVMMFESVVSWNSGVVSCSPRGCRDTGNPGRRN